MILSALRLLRSLSGYHYRTIILTVLLPTLFSLAISYFELDLVLKIVLIVIVFPVWSVIAVLAVARMLKRDRSEAERQVSQKVEALSVQIPRLREEQEESRVALHQEVDNLEKTVRSTFEKLGIVLPRRPISVNAGTVRIRFDVPEPKVTLVRGSRVARLRLRLLRAMSRLWEVVYGRQEVS